MVHTDPNGDVLPTIAVAAIAGGLIGGSANVWQNWNNINNLWDGLAAFGIGTAAGAAGAALGTVAVMGSAALATGAAAASATGVSVGGYTFSTTGAISGAVGETIGSPLRQLGNTAMDWQDEFSYSEWGMSIVAGGVMGGTIGGLVALKQSQNFWWGNSKSLSTIRGIAAGEGLERVIDGNTISDVPENADVRAGQEHVYRNTVEKYYKSMADETFDAAANSRGISGFLDKSGMRVVTGGHHRITAATAFGMKTGDYSILNQLISGGKFATGGSSNYGYNAIKWPTRWILK